MARNKLGYQWHLRMRMAEAGMFATTDLTPLLGRTGCSALRGANLSPGHRNPGTIEPADTHGAVRHPGLHT